MSFADLESERPLAGRRGASNGRQDSTQAVAAGVFQINTAVSTFQRLVNTLGTPKGTPELREKLHKTRLHIGQLVKDTSAKLKQASETDHHAEVSASKKIADAKLAKDFQAVLKEFQKAQRLAVERETAYTPFVPQSVLPSRRDLSKHKHWEYQLHDGILASSYHLKQVNTHGLCCYSMGWLFLYEVRTKHVFMNVMELRQIPHLHVLSWANVGQN